MPHHQIDAVAVRLLVAPFRESANEHIQQSRCSDFVQRTLPLRDSAGIAPDFPCVGWGCRLVASVAGCASGVKYSLLYRFTIILTHV